MYHKCTCIIILRITRFLPYSQFHYSNVIYILFDIRVNTLHSNIPPILNVTKTSYYFIENNKIRKIHTQQPKKIFTKVRNL